MAPTRFTARQFLSTLFILVPVAVLVYALIHQQKESRKPTVIDGTLDLTGWNFRKDGSVPLNGKWAFYWNELLTPQQVDVKQQQKFINVPGIWNNFSPETSADGYATYAMTIHSLQPGQELAFNLRTVSNAYRLFANGKEIAANGIVGVDKTNSQPEYRPQVVTYRCDSTSLQLVMQVSNFVHCKGGFWLPVEIGDVGTVQRERDLRVLLEMFLFGCLFIMALYHFSLYFLRRADASTLFFGIMCAAIGFRSLLTGENLVNFILPGLDWFVARKIEYLLTFISAPVYVTFARILYPQEWNKTIYRIIVGFGLALALFVLVTPSTIYTKTSYVFTGYAWLTSVYTIFVFARSVARKKEGAGVFLATSLFFLLTIVNDTLNQMEIIHTGLYLSFGLFIVTFAQAFILSSRFAVAFHNLEVYSDTLHKFVPKQFLGKIAKDGIASIRPGNAEKSQVTVLFSDMNSFTRISEQMTPSEVFGMLNEYLSWVEPPIRANHGFVDKYLGDGIMALFEKAEGQNNALNAVNAALNMQEALDNYNKKRVASGRKELFMNCGLHSGEVIIGTIGGNERMDSTAIGDVVNLASRIEGMTRFYGVSLLVSEETIRQLGDTSGMFLRFVDTVTAKGKTEPVAIWEIIGRKTKPGLTVFTSLLPAWEAAMELYREGRYKEARAKFSECLSLLPDDSVSRYYVRRCSEAMVGGGTGSPNVTKFTEK